MQKIGSKILGITCLGLTAVSLLSGCANKKNQYTITYHFLNGDTETQKVNEGVNFTLMPAKGYETHTFYDYYTDSGFKNEVNEETFVADKSYDFYALYNKNNHYFVTYFDALESDFRLLRDEVEANTDYTFQDDPFVNQGNYAVSYTDANNTNKTYYPNNKQQITNHLELMVNWQKEYKGFYKDKEYSVRIYKHIVGLGSAVMIIDGKKKNGFYNAKDSSFEFYFGTDDEWEFDEDIQGVITGEDSFITCNTDEKGMYYLSDLIKSENNSKIALTLDGYDIAIITEYDGQGLQTLYYGSYKKTDNGDFLLTDINPNTGNPTGKSLNFRINKLNNDYSGNSYNGYFEVKGLENDAYYLYEDFEINNNVRLTLNGYGEGFYETDFNNESGKYQTVKKGKYVATVPTNEYNAIKRSVISHGYFTFVGDDGSVNIQFKTELLSSKECVFIKYNKQLNDKFTKENNETTYPYILLDGYSIVTLVTAPNKEEYGTYFFNSKTNEIKCEISGESDNYTIEAKLDLTNKTYSLKGDGLVIEGNTIIQYDGTSSIVEIPEGITEIADDAFNYLYTNCLVREVYIPSSVTKIGLRAFENNGSLKLVYFQGNVPPSIDQTSFRWPGGEFKMIVPNGSGETYKNANVFATSYAKYIMTKEEYINRPTFEINDGVLLSFNPKENENYSSIKIPDEVTTIGNGAFRSVSFINKVDLNNVTKVGSQAFENCENIASITATKLKYIDSAAFLNCALLNNVELPAIEDIGSQAFSGCYTLSKVRCGSNLKSIGDQAFSQCSITVYTNGDEEILANNLFYLTLTGTVPPKMGGKVFYGTSPKIIVGSMDVALNYYQNGENWTAYFNHFFVESGSEKGDYVDVTNLLGVKVDGRMEVYEFEVFFYKIEGSKVTFYYLDDGILNSFEGQYDPTNGFVIEGTQFVLKGTKLTYKNGNETLVIDTNYARDGYSYVYNAKYNDQDVKIIATNSSVTMTVGYTKYTLTLSVNKTFTYTTSVATHTETYTNSDGSKLTITFSNNSVLVKGTLQGIKRSDGNPLTTEMGWYAKDLGNNMYSFTVQWQQTNYDITITLSGATFTYTYEVSTRITCKTAANDVVTVTVDKDNQVKNIVLAFRESDGGLLNATLTWSKENDYYILNVNFNEETIDSTTGNTISKPSSRNGTYKLTLDLTAKSATLTKLS